jgi:sortase (surface protein transpeptidase)
MAKTKAAKKKATTRQRAKQPLPVKAATKPKKTTARKAKAAAKPRSVRRQTKKFTLSIGPNTTLVLELKRTRKPASKSARKKRNTPKAVFGRFTESYKARLPVLLVVAGLVGTIYFGTDVFRARPNLTIYSPPAPSFETAKPLPLLKAKTFPKSEPVSIKVPSINMDVSLITVGRNQDNTLEVPSSAGIPGWYRLSPTPGELGPSIIVGHVDSPDGPAVFWRLRELSAGQIIEIKRADNTTVRFKVTRVHQFEQDNFPTDEVYGNIDHSGLRLITCGGTFSRLSGQYSHNTVVFASLEI